MRSLFVFLFIGISISLFSQTSSVSISTNYSINEKPSFALSTSQYYNIKQSSIWSKSNELYYSIANQNSNSAISVPVYYSITNGISNSSASTSLNNNILASKNVLTAGQTSQNSYILEDLPNTNIKSENTFVLIIGNEDYKSFQSNLRKEQNVDFALNDARSFKELCIKTFGVPIENVLYIENAGFLKMKQSISQLNLISKHSSGKANLIFYYAGHGLPDEQTKIPYIIPVDVSGTSLEYAISLPSLYKSLTEYPANKVVILLDACFTGEGRNLGLVSSRGVKVKPKQEIISGENLVVFCSSTSDQASLPYRDKQHGMFTYFLINKYIENKGDVNLGDLEDYLYNKIPTTSILINKAEQVPTIFFGPNVSEHWKKWKLN